jgi:hypothetical protein
MCEIALAHFNVNKLIRFTDLPCQKRISTLTAAAPARVPPTDTAKFGGTPRELDFPPDGVRIRATQPHEAAGRKCIGRQIKQDASKVTRSDRSKDFRKRLATHGRGKGKFPAGRNRAKREKRRVGACGPRSMGNHGKRIFPSIAWPRKLKKRASCDARFF